MLLLPTIFATLREKTFYIFGIVNFVSIPFVWAFYPESNQRTLEEMDLLFATDSWWNWKAESTFAKLKAQNPELVQTTRLGETLGNPEAALELRTTRGPSLVVASE